LVHRAASSVQDDPDRRRALDRLHTHLLRLQVSSGLSDLDDALANLASGATVRCGQESVAYRRLALHLAQEERPEQRRLLWSAAARVRCEHRRLQQERIERWRELVQQQLNRTASPPPANGVSLAPFAEQVLCETRGVYEALLARVLPRESGVGLTEAQPCDLPALVHAQRYWSHFDATQRSAALRETLTGLGLSARPPLEAILQREDGSMDGDRVACVAVQVPDDIRFCAPAACGLSSFEGLYHAVGHALPHLFNLEEAFEFRCLGLADVHEAFGILIENQVSTPLWLRRWARLPHRLERALAELQAFRLLLRTRMGAARVLWEARILESGAEGWERVGLALAERATGLPESEDLVPTALQPPRALGTCSSEGLLGCLLQAVLERGLTAKYGEGWASHRGTGAYLVRLWERGGRYDAEEFLNKLGERRWRLEPLLKQVASLESRS
jgi:hypothetical protein